MSNELRPRPNPPLVTENGENMNWQPIETAPQDGKPLDLWVIGDNFAERFADCEWRQPTKSALMRGLLNDDPQWCYEQEIYADTHYCPVTDHGKATHWMRATAPQP